MSPASGPAGVEKNVCADFLPALAQFKAMEAPLYNNLGRESEFWIGIVCHPN